MLNDKKSKNYRLTSASQRLNALYTFGIGWLLYIRFEKQKSKKFDVKKILLLYQQQTLLPPCSMIIRLCKPMSQVRSYNHLRIIGAMNRWHSYQIQSLLLYFYPCGIHCIWQWAPFNNDYWIVLTVWDRDFDKACRLRALASATAIMAAASPLALLMCSCRSASVNMQSTINHAIWLMPRV